MVQQILAYVIVAGALAWTIRRFWPKRRARPAATMAKPDSGCENCDCGR